MSEVRVRENESLESALKRFKRSCAKSGVLAEVRKREHYESPSVKRRKKSEAARKNRKSSIKSAKACVKMTQGFFPAFLLAGQAVHPSSSPRSSPVVSWAKNTVPTPISPASRSFSRILPASSNKTKCPCPPTI